MVLRRFKYHQTKRELQSKLRFWQHELGYHYQMDLYTLKVISNCFYSQEPLTKFCYHLPILEEEEDDWSN
jgi:hypothetical protein